MRDTIAAFAAFAASVAFALATIGFCPPVGADPNPVEPLSSALARAESLRRSSDPAAEVSALIRVLELDPTHPATHARLAEMTGPAPRSGRTTPAAKIQRAFDHPYDPAALLAGGEALAAQGRSTEAIELLEKAVWLADLDPASALDALLKLREWSGAWAARRVVPVHVYADAALRSGAGWRFALRTAWLSASNSLDDVLQTRFVPILIAPFDAAGDVDPDGERDELDALYGQFVATTDPPEEGILALITGRPVSPGPGARKKGVAELLGRSLAVRLDPGASQTRVLAHELLHLYGAIHVLDDLESLMNPTGSSLKLDSGSCRIAQAMARRAFASGGIERNVLPFVELRRATDAYLAALSTNLVFRDAGIVEAKREVSRARAVDRVHHATRLDPHLGDAARVVAVLMIADGRRSEALRLLELASQLYGEDTVAGKQATAEADVLRQQLAGSTSAASPAP